MKTAFIYLAFALICFNSQAQNYSRLELTTKNNIWEVKKGEEIVVKKMTDSRFKGNLTRITDTSLFIENTEIPFREIKCVKQIRKTQKNIAMLLLANGLVSGGALVGLTQIKFGDNYTLDENAQILLTGYSGVNILIGTIMLKKRRFHIHQELKLVPKK